MSQINFSVKDLQLVINPFDCLLRQGEDVKFSTSDSNTYEITIDATEHFFEGVNNPLTFQISFGHPYPLKIASPTIGSSENYDVKVLTYPPIPPTAAPPRIIISQ